MPNWDSKDFDSRGADIARAYFAGQGQGGSDLTSLVTKTARDNNLNPEQIKRLSRSANTKAFEQKFAALEGNPDGRVAEFDVANEEAVISSLYKDAATQGATKTASAFYPDLADERKPVHVEIFQKTAATAEEDVDAIRRSLRVDRPDRELMRLEKAANELHVREKAAEMNWEDSMEWLQAASKGIYWDHDEFEKSAIALHGMDVLPELNMLRSQNKLPSLDLTVEKCAAIQDRVLVSETAGTHKLKVASTARVTFIQTKAAITDASARIASLRETIRRGA